MGRGRAASERASSASSQPHVPPLAMSMSMSTSEARRVRESERRRVGGGASTADRANQSHRRPVPPLLPAHINPEGRLGVVVYLLADALVASLDDLLLTYR